MPVGVVHIDYCIRLTLNPIRCRLRRHRCRVQLLQKEPIETKRNPIQQTIADTKLPKKKEIINLKLDRTREMIEDKEREMRTMRARK